MSTIAQSDLSCLAVYLEHYPEPGEGAHRLLVKHFPFSIGRNPAAHYCINARHVSKEHAQIVREGEHILICDLGSTNGTFVNGKQVERAALTHGDIIHVAYKEFRFIQDSPVGAGGAKESLTGGGACTDRASRPLPASFIQSSEFLKELLQRRSVRSLFQPIVDLRTRAVMGHEALGRGTHEKLNASPVYLFGVAAQCNRATDLSRLMRQVAVQQANDLPPGARLFLNLHPAEFRDDNLLRTLDSIPEAVAGKRQVVLEFHEEAVADVKAIRRLRERLVDLGIGLAYDDFGSGQARLSELAEVPPDYIKLDKTLIHELHLAQSRQALVLALIRLSADLGISVIAEGIETAEEAEVCIRLGCQFGQGYFFGRPQPVVSPARETAILADRMVLGS